MNTITIKCDKCKKFFNIDNVKGVHICPNCECEVEHFVFDADMTPEQIVKTNNLASSLTNLFKKNDVKMSKNEIMDFAMALVLK